MNKITESHVFTGMQRDLGISKHPIQFLYEGRNIRLTARDGENSLLVISNEKGTEDKNVTVTGQYLGHCLLNSYLVVFSTDVRRDSSIDYIIRIDLSSDNLQKTELYRGTSDVSENLGLGFSIGHPIEAIASYENENIQKVYWTDGFNQPRMINIAPSNDGMIGTYTPTSFDFIRELSLNENISIQKQLGLGFFAPGVIQYAFTYYTKYGQESNIFYTSPLLYISHRECGGSPDDSRIANAFKITVENIDKSFDYLRIYSIQRTSIDGTPIVKRVQDINTKSASADISNVGHVISVYSVEILDDGIFKDITEVLTDLDKKENFTMPGTGPGCGVPHDWFFIEKNDYENLKLKTSKGYVTWGSNSPNTSAIFLYIQNRLGIIYECNTNDPVDVSNIINLGLYTYEDAVTFLDTGTEGDSVDPTELLYKGGESIIAQTLEQKDNTLFFGNIDIQRKLLDINERQAIKDAVTLTTGTRIFYPTVISSDSYAYASQLTSYDANGKSVPCNGFKRGDYYRLGVQFQYKTGKWSDPVFIEDKLMDVNPAEDTNDNSISVPVFKGTLSANEAENLLDSGYRKVRAVAVYPDMLDRVTLCQGVTCPTLYTDNHREYTEEGEEKGDKDLYAQSSWFFRPKSIDSIGASDVTVAPFNLPQGGNDPTLFYTSYAVGGTNTNGFNPTEIRKTEIQGEYNTHDKFKIDNKFITFHSPDIEFDNSLQHVDFSGMAWRLRAQAEFTTTLSDIDIQTETPPISSRGSGFIHKSFKDVGAKGIVSGLFYDDYSVDDSDIIKCHPQQKSSMKWLVYPWHRTGSLNNDIERPANMGARTAVLKKKVISNLRWSSTIFFNTQGIIRDFEITPQLFSSDQVSIVKLGDKIYRGNIDTILSPVSSKDGLYFAFDNGVRSQAGDLPDIKTEKINTPFYSTQWFKTYVTTYTEGDSRGNEGFWGHYVNNSVHYWAMNDNKVGEDYHDLVLNSAGVRMKYKSTPHLVINGGSYNFLNSGPNCLTIIEVVRKGDNANSTYRSTMFGGTSEDALKANTWIPCGEPVKLANTNGTGSTQGNVEFEYSWGDTYFQRWDCLKTYAFTPEDINQIVEIGSFMLETRINIDGRYDRNRGQMSNLNMSPLNFNLLNPVYSQVNNFFSYKILDDDFYTHTHFPNQITWSKEKHAGAEIDLWTNVTLASTYDMDGSKGEITSLNLWKNSIFCFQNKGISNILFNSRVQIPVSDGVPIEISNNYKVDGYNYICDGIGCKDKQLIKETPVGIYFIDSVGGNLFHIGEGLTDISSKCNLTSVFSNPTHPWRRLLYDDINHDLYVVQNNQSLCYSELLQQFTGFMDYDNIFLIETCNNKVFTLHANESSEEFPDIKSSKLYQMFTGEYCNFFGNNKDWGFTFISNGLNEGAVTLSKMFTNLEFRADVEGDGTLDDETGKFTPALPLDYLEVWNDYQHGYATLQNKNGWDTAIHHSNDGSASLKRKFRIWRCDVPRNNCLLDNQRIGSEKYSQDLELGISRKIRKPLDRMTNPWLYLKFHKEAAEDNSYLSRTEIHDLSVTYFV